MSQCMAVKVSDTVVALNGERVIVLHGDSGAVRLAPNSIDSIVTDPPAGIGFMGKGWDDDKGGAEHWVAWLAKTLTPWFDALKPGGHALVWAIPRTSDWTMAALRLCGFEIRDQIHDMFDADTLAHNFVDALDEEQRHAFLRLLESQASPILYHLFGSGFPKSLDVSKAIDQRLGATRDVVGSKLGQPGYHLNGGTVGSGVLGDGLTSKSVEQRIAESDITAPGSPEAAQWGGWGTALKPAAEHWILCRKPLDGTVAATVLKHGTGGLNIDACRIGTGTDVASAGGTKRSGGIMGSSEPLGGWEPTPGVGRWPAHVTLDEHAAALLDRQSGKLTSGGGDKGSKEAGGGLNGSSTFAMRARSGEKVHAPSHGGASRFYYIAKPPRSEKDAGLSNHLGDGVGSVRNSHPTVKSIALMEWLIKLVTPPGGVVADPFGGSGTTAVATLGLGMRAITCELTDDYVPIILRRVAHALRNFDREDRQASLPLSQTHE